MSPGPAFLHGTAALCGRSAARRIPTTVRRKTRLIAGLADVLTRLGGGRDAHGPLRSAQGFEVAQLHGRLSVIGPSAWVGPGHRGATGSVARELLGVVHGLGEGVPGEGGALDAHREFLDAAEGFEVAQFHLWLVVIVFGFRVRRGHH
jgi:hypothetical protein